MNLNLNLDGNLNFNLNLKLNRNLNWGSAQYSTSEKYLAFKKFKSNVICPDRSIQILLEVERDSMWFKGIEILDNDFSEVEYCALPQLRFLFSLRFRLKFRFPFRFKFKFMFQ